MSIDTKQSSISARSGNCSLLIIAVSAIIWWSSPIFAEPGDVYTGPDGIRSVDVGSPSGGNSGGSSHGVSLAPGTTSIWDSMRKAKEAKQDAKHQESFDANEEGVEFCKKGELEKAIAAFEKSLKIEPGDAIVLKNLASTRRDLADAQAQQRNLQQAKEAEARQHASAERMNQSIQDLARSLAAAPTTSGGLDFDGGSTSTARGGESGGLDFTAAITAPPPSGDPKVVDARNVPSGLPKAVENMIAESYPNSSPDVLVRVRRGFEAVINHDWTLAKPYFEDALIHEPGNAKLKRMVDLAQWMVDSSKVKEIKTVHPITAGLNAAARGDNTEAIHQFELAKAELTLPSLKAHCDRMIVAIKQKSEQPGGNGKFDVENEKYWRGVVDNLENTGMSRLMMDDGEGARKAFDDAEFYSMFLPTKR